MSDGRNKHRGTSRKLDGACKESAGVVKTSLTNVSKEKTSVVGANDDTAGVATTSTTELAGGERIDP